MASNVNFSNKQIFLNKNQPLDQKIIIENLNYIDTIIKPYVGMQFCCKTSTYIYDDGSTQYKPKYYVVKRLADGYFDYSTNSIQRSVPKKADGSPKTLNVDYIVVPDCLIDNRPGIGFEELFNDSQKEIEHLKNAIESLLERMQNLQNEMEIIKNEEAQLCLTDSDGNFLLDANGNYLVITS